LSVSAIRSASGNWIAIDSAMISKLWLSAVMKGSV
jgi:hypothetical protein